METYTDGCDGAPGNNLDFYDINNDPLAYKLDQAIPAGATGGYKGISMKSCAVTDVDDGSSHPRDYKLKVYKESTDNGCDDFYGSIRLPPTSLEKVNCVPLSSPAMCFEYAEV